MLYVPVEREPSTERSLSLRLWRQRNWVEQGDRARDQKNWERAARFYGLELQRNPRNAAIWVQYGHALKESGRIQQAETAYRRALQYAPDVADTHLQLGHALKLRGRRDEAVASYVRACLLQPALQYPQQELLEMGWSEMSLAELISAASANNG